MPTTYAFKVEDVRRLVKHCQAAPAQMEYYGEKLEPSLLLVGDQGVYLMSNGTPADLLDPSDDGKKIAKRFVAYADGINPDVDKDWYDTKVSLFGGDDGAEPIPLEFFQIALAAAKKYIWVEVTETQIKVKA